MHTILISDIIIPATRQRQEFDPDSLMELMESIRTTGLLHPPVLRKTSDGMQLVTGERRLKAIQDLWALGGELKYGVHDIDGVETVYICPEGMVPYTNLGELSELEAEEAELDENIKRRDLTWQELAAAHQRLHRLREKQRRAAQKEGFDTPQWSVADTAKELTGRSDGAYQDKVRRELIVAKNLDNLEVQKAKSVDEAFKILKRQEQTEKNIKMAEQVGRTFSASTHKLFNTNCLEWMEMFIKAEDRIAPLFDVILTDPPYGMGADSFNDGAGKMNNIEHHYIDSYENWLKLMTAWCPLSYQVCKPQAHAYVFCDIDRFHELKKLMQDAGWYVFRTPLIHYKPDSGRVPLPDQGPRRQYELILYAIKGKKPITHIYPDVISTTAGQQLSHGAQKPVELFRNLLQRSVLPGDTILDSFAGTGPIIPAAHSFKCQAVVIEQEKEYYATCVERIKELEEGV